jgi:mgtE-like transporter
MPLLTLCVFIEIFAGQILQLGQDKFLMIPLFLISIPYINGVGGNIGSILGARLASGLHVGYIELHMKDKNIQQNLLTSIIMGLITYFILSIVIYYISLISGLHIGIGLIDYMTVILLTGFLLVCIISFISVLTAFWSFKKGLDPDDMVAPVVTTTGDTLGIIFLFLLIGVI